MSTCSRGAECEKQLAAGGKKERTPKGHFVVYVGSELKRFVVSMSYLKKPCFQQLLQESAEMYGFQSRKGIVLPCDTPTFQSLLELEKGK